MAGGILLTGSTGQVGRALLQALLPLRAIAGEVHAPSRAALDLADAESIRAAVRALRPRWIVNPGAYTAVDKAESEPAVAMAINAEAPRILGEEAEAIGAAVVHFSTDYVFSGEGTEPYTEDDATGPVGVYGASKLAGERALADAGAAHLIVRTSWVYGATGKNFLLTVLRVAREQAEMKIVADQHGAPTWSRDLARLTAHLLADRESAASGSRVSIAEAVRALDGVYHAAGAGQTTWHGFASAAVEQMREREPEAGFATLTPIPTSEYVTPARRPANSRLNCEKLDRAFGWRMPEWRHSLAQVLDELSGGKQ